MGDGSTAAFAEPARWQPERPRLRPTRLVLSWLVGALALLGAAAIVPGVRVEGFLGAAVVAILVGILNALLPPLIAALRLPFTLALNFLLVLVADAMMLLAADSLTHSAISIPSFRRALLTALVVAAVTIVLEVLFGTNDDDEFTFRVVRRVARRQGEVVRTDAPGILFLEIDGLALPVLRRAMRDGNAPTMARWLAEHDYQLTRWETDLSSQTGASQAGILLGSNDDIPAFRWVEKETATMMTCSAPSDCAEIERRHASGKGLLLDGGASRGNLLSGEADEVILTVSRIEAEKGANPGYRAFFANGFNVTRVLVLFFWEVILEWVAALRAIRRDVRPRGHRGGIYPLIRAAMCVIVRDLIVYGVLTDMMRGRPAVYATFSSYDEVAHHSGLERADTLEALRKLDQQFGRIDLARRYAPRPYEIVVLSDHGQTQGATFRQRNGYGLDDLVQRSLEGIDVSEMAGGDEQDAMVGHALGEATGRSGKKKRPKNDVSDQPVVVMGSGNLGLVYLMDERRRLTLEEIAERHPRLIGALREHPHVGWLLVRSSQHGPLVLGGGGAHYLANGRVEGEDPLAQFSPNAPRHLLRTDGFAHVADIMIGSFYDPALDEGCAFEELISFHGGLGGPQTEAFILHPQRLTPPGEPLIGAAHVNEVLRGWRAELLGAGGAGVFSPR
ncbi:MAG: phage holin family protein [Thermoleophilia bacterium]|nr:phage holin family protein [Thermoleophilia bacterium]MDH4345295.1 phage holin family protein [Thermoleophilia bacterium]MDH5333861.1 phage holin family protein [Thermoleophilia bacterium]